MAKALGRGRTAADDGAADARGAVAVREGDADSGRDAPAARRERVGRPGAPPSGNGRSRGLETAIVGAGLMGRWHARAARRAGGRLRYVVDRDLRRASALKGASHGARAVTTIGAALADPAVGIVHVCTPSGTHAAPVASAIEAGCHV